MIKAKGYLNFSSNDSNWQLGGVSTGIFRGFAINRYEDEGNTGAQRESSITQMTDGAGFIRWCTKPLWFSLTNSKTYSE